MSSSHPRILLTGLLAVGTAFAQQQPPRPVIPSPAGNPGVPAGNPAVQGANANDPDAPKSYLEPKLNGESLAEIYTELTGRRVAISTAALTAEFHFVQKDPVGKQEALELLKIAALIEGFVFVPSGSNTDSLVWSQSAANIRSAGLPVITRVEDLPAGHDVVTYVMSLKNIKPDDAKRTFEAVLVQQNSAYGSIAPVPNASSIIITDSTQVIRTLIELQKKIDVPSANIGTQFIKVQYADVTELADTLNQLVGSQQQQGQTSASINRNQPQPNGAPPGVTPTGESSAGEQVPIQIVPNARTNEIFVMGRPADIIFVEGLVRGFDSQTDQKNFLRRKLKFLAVADFLPVAQQALERTFSSAANGGGNGQGSGANFGGQGGRNGQGGQNGGRNGQTAGNTRSSSTGSTSSTGSSSGTGSSSSSSSGGSGGLNAPDVNTAPVAQLVGRTLLVADNITNSIVIQGPPASLEVVSHLLDELDVRAEQVMISCVFGQLRLDDTKTLGVDYASSLATKGNSAIAGRAGSGTLLTGVVPLSPTATTPFDPGSLAATTGLSLYGKVGPYLNLYLQALQTNEKFTVLSRPTIYVSNNQKGSISSGTKIAVPTGSYNGGASSGISTNFEYRDVELKLEVIPLVNSANELTLQIYLDSQDLGSNRTVGEFSIPDILDRELLTNVTVPNNETIVLGGLITTHDDRTKNGIPFLSQIPLIGGLFGTNSVTKNRDELLIFIQPKIVKDSASLYEAQNDMSGRYKVDDLGREFIQGPNQAPTRTVEVEQVDPKSSKKTTKTTTTRTTTTSTVPESKGGPRRASSRPSNSDNR